MVNSNAHHGQFHDISRFFISIAIMTFAKDIPSIQPLATCTLYFTSGLQHPACKP